MDPRIMLPPHLGGHQNYTNTDAGALEYLVETLGVKSMIDVGCGVGGQVRVALTLGLEAVGVDGDYTIQPDFPMVVHDYTTGPLEPGRGYDLAWSVEFLEHVEEQYMDNYMDTFKRCRYLVVTHATRGQGGHHHVNEQDWLYWIVNLHKHGFTYLKRETNEMRRRSTMATPYMKRTGRLLRNDDLY